MASLVSSEEDYWSCVDEMDSEEVLSSDSVFNNSESNKLLDSSENAKDKVDSVEVTVSLETDSDDQPSTVLIYSTADSVPLLSQP